MLDQKIDLMEILQWHPGFKLIGKSRSNKYLFTCLDVKQ
jgi:hypothetical protein